jgi:DNA-binding MarR family transcriptional regulator/GNAT superfamily N-acetyltransferase
VSDVRLAERVREFNRFYTRLLGVLDEGLLDSPYTLTEVRLLFEIRRGEPIEVALLRRVLGLDAGYLSRILSRFDAAGLTVRQACAHDARAQTVGLTAAGREVFDDLDARSRDQIVAMLAGLSEAARGELVQAMAVMRAHLDPVASPGPVELRGPRAGELGWVISRNGALYAAEYGWNVEYEALVAQIVAGFAAHHDPLREAAWIAELDSRPVGSIFCMRGDDDRTAKLRVLLVEPAARGHGIGAALIQRCLDFARRAGYQRITLWTVSLLAPARRLYQRAGFELVAEEDVRLFGACLTGQTWSRDL